jgi:hypothetical protein
MTRSIEVTATDDVVERDDAGQRVFVKADLPDVNTVAWDVYVWLAHQFDPGKSQPEDERLQARALVFPAGWVRACVARDLALEQERRVFPYRFAAMATGVENPDPGPGPGPGPGYPAMTYEWHAEGETPASHARRLAKVLDDALADVIELYERFQVADRAVGDP